MASITAAAVKALRDKAPDKTQLPIMVCKQALQENNGDEEAAIQWLRERGYKGLPREKPASFVNKPDPDRKQQYNMSLVMSGAAGMLLIIAARMGSAEGTWSGGTTALFLIGALIGILGLAKYLVNSD